MTYDWISTWWQIKKVYDIEKKEIIARVNRWKIIDNFIYGCWEYGYWPGYVELYYLDSWIFRDFSPVDTMVKECNFTDNHLYFTLINNEQITELQTVEQWYQHKFDIDNNQLYSRDIGNATWIKVENSVVEQYPVQKNYINSKHLWNNFILKQTLEQSNLEYQWKTVKTWSHYSEKNPFIDIEWCNKLTKIILDNNYDYRNREDSWWKLSSTEQEECIAEHYNKSVEVKKTPHSRFFSIYKYFYEWADVSLFDSENLRIYEWSFWYSITKIEEWASGFFIQYFHPLWDWGWLKLLESNWTVTDLIENNCDGANTIVERVDCYSITDFELMINKQVKVFYTNWFDEKKEIILNIGE